MKPLNRNAQAESLSVQQMLTFCTVCELGGYASAQATLGLAGPTLWEQIKALERIYGTKLFERQGRNVRPSVAGSALYKVLRPLVASIDSTFEVVAEATNAPMGHLTLVTGVRMILEELGQPLRKFVDAYPNVRLHLMTADNRAAQESVLNNQADLALFIEPPPELVAEGLELQQLYPIDYLAALPPKHRLGKRSELSLSDLMNESLILGNSNTVGRKLLEQAVFRLGRRTPLQIVAETDNSAVTIACVRAGLGIGIIAGRLGSRLTKGIITRSLAHEMGQVQVVAAHRAGRQLSQVARTLLELLRHPG